MTRNANDFDEFCHFAPSGDRPNREVPINRQC